MSPKAFVVGVVVLVVLKLGVAAGWPLLDDEAYYWVWAQRPAAGYYDQPPLIAWLILATTSLFGDAEWAVRLGSVLCTAVAPIALVWAGEDRAFTLAWWAAVPGLAWLTWLCTPDAPLLALWAVAVAGGLAGGRGWWVAGVAAGLAMECKYTGAAVYPLLVMAVGPREWRSPHVWAGALVAAVLVLPNVVWNAQNDWVALRFQLDEGLISSAPPGVAGLVRQVGDQGIVLGGLLAVAVVWWLVRAAPDAVRGWYRSDPDGRALRVAWFTSAPLLVFFAWAGTRDVSDAHWPVIAYVGVGVGLARAVGPLARLVRVSLFVAGAAVVASVVHVYVPLVVMEHDPAVRLGEGRAVASAAATWAFREGAPHGREGVADARTVYTERYQEAALIHYYLGIPAHRYPACGRADQYDLWPLPDAGADAIYVRPGTTGRKRLCTDDAFTASGPAILTVRDPAGRRARNRQVWELTPR